MEERCIEREWQELSSIRENQVTTRKRPAEGNLTQLPGKCCKRVSLFIHQASSDAKRPCVGGEMAPRVDGPMATLWYKLYNYIARNSSIDGHTRQLLFATLYYKFVRESVAIARTLIKDKFKRKATFQPLSMQKGIAGGDKYLIDGIFFKFPTNTEVNSTGQRLYKSMESALKTCSLELKALNAILQVLQPAECSVSEHDLAVPMAVVVDYCGWRVYACCYLHNPPRLDTTNSETSCDIKQKLSNLADHFHLTNRATPYEISLPLPQNPIWFKVKLITRTVSRVPMQLLGWPGILKLSMGT